MIISLVESRFKLLKEFQKEYIWDGCFLILLLWSVKLPYVQIVYQSFTNENLFNLQISAHFPW